jgi:hypothetical protein
MVSRMGEFGTLCDLAPARASQTGTKPHLAPPNRALHTGLACCAAASLTGREGTRTAPPSGPLPRLQRETCEGPSVALHRLPRMSLEAVCLRFACTGNASAQTRLSELPVMWGA